ncbi:MAG: chromate transporter, partial [Clostridia bacterium]|nr:chromate transporter [Clostridia bacterium]
LATGVYMIAKNALPITSGATFNVKSFGLTIVLLGLMFGSKKLIGKKISPIMLIVISAVLGAIVYAI